MTRFVLLAVLQVGSAEFGSLLERLAEGWNEGDSRKAADCFTEDAIYTEPPDRQLYRGREELYRFFGGDSGRPGAMSMSRRNVVFDEVQTKSIWTSTIAHVFNDWFMFAASMVLEALAAAGTAS